MIEVERQRVKKQIAVLLSVLLLISGSPMAVMAAGEGMTDIDMGESAVDMDMMDGMTHFQRVSSYRDGQFTDVTPEDWYNAGVGAAYELGLMQGASEDYFDAAGLITVEQAVVMAARLHSIYHTGSGEFAPGEFWSEPYVSYAIEKGIISEDMNLYDLATRAQFGDILSRSLPEEALEPINEVGENAIPDVRSWASYADSIYKLYRAGIVTGGNEQGEFQPENSISRAEAAVIITRIADKSLRQSITIQTPEYLGPDLTVREAMDDSFFARSAILGNSLAEGLRLYSNLKTLHYFSATSTSVVSATKTKNTTLDNGSTGTLIQALSQEQYDRIYIELGINEIYFNVDYFTDIYGDMIDRIKQAEPEADIYILSILPVTKRKSDSDSVRNMARVYQYNMALRTLAAEKQCYYMDLCAMYQGEDGYLPAGWSSDGVHLYAQYYSLWESCMRTMYK